MNDNISVLLVDDHAMLRKGMALLLGEEADIEVVGEAGDGEQAIAQARALQPDVVVMDINMPGVNGIEATRQVVSEFPAIKIIALSIHSGKRFVDDMLSAGAVGYLLKESVPEELLQGIRAVMRGDMYLSSAITSTVVGAYVEGMSAVEEDEPPQIDIGILQTKLHRPAPPLDLVTRTRLLERLTARRERPLTLVSAPAGYGKSILISNWLEHSDWPGAWLSLDESDSDLRQFVSYFVAGVQSIFAHVCEETCSLIGAPQLPSLLTLAGNLANELEAIGQPFMLVLDDYHRIDAGSPVNELLQQLLERPPIPLHLVILTRRDPPLQLLNLRAKGQITEIRMQDLGFTRQESRELLEKSVGFTVAEEALTNLQQVMEGWAVGLQLVSLTLRRIGDPNQFLNKLHGGIQQIREYLIQEVLASQSPEMREWLLKTAILDRFCAPLCDAMCAHAQSAGTLPFDSAKFIGEVLNNNLFSIPLDTHGRWFRYHHLFQHLLQHELEARMPAGEIAALHLRASDWFESRGLIEEAIQHAMKAGDVVSAADIIEQHQQIELDKDRWYIVERWLAMLPLETIQQRPKLLLSQMWGQYNTYQMLEIPPLLERVESLLVDETVDESLLGEINFYRGFMLAIFQGDAEGALIQLEQARKRLSRSQTRNILSEIEVVDAIAHQMAGEGALSIHSLNQRIQAIGSGKGLFLSRLVAGLVFSHLLSANLEAVIPAAQLFTRVSKKTRLINTEGSSHYLRANADLHAYHLDEALQGFQHAAKKRDIMHRKLAIDAQAGLVLTYQALQRSDDAVEAMKHLMAFALGTDEPEHIVVAQSCHARLSLLQGDLKPAIDWAHSYDAAAHAPSMLMWLEIPVITQLRVMIIAGSHESMQQASESLAMLRQSAEAIHNTYQSIDLLALQSLTLEKLGRADEAVDVLQQAIKLGEPGSWIRPFVELGEQMAGLLRRLGEREGFTEYLNLILDKFPTDAVAPAIAAANHSKAILTRKALTTEPLTNRELDILELLSQRLRNKEIAARLFVSPETVKGHLKNLYQKLDVHNRREAVLKAAEIVAAGTGASLGAGHSDSK